MVFLFNVNFLKSVLAFMLPPSFKIFFLHITTLYIIKENKISQLPRGSFLFFTNNPNPCPVFDLLRELSCSPFFTK
jgi:hypothetical protein